MRIILFCLLLTILAILANPANAGLNKEDFSVGPVAGFEFRYTESDIIVNDATVGQRKQFKQVGLITTIVIKYNITDYANVFVGYGLAQRKFLAGSQVAVIGFQFDDLVGVTIFGGADLGACGPNGCADYDPFGAINSETRWFIAIGYTFNAFSFDLDNMLDGETLEK